MSQYLSRKLCCVTYILFNFLISLSFCDNQSFQIFVFNDSLIIDKNLNSDLNSSLNSENKINASKSTKTLNNINYKNYKSVNLHNPCVSDDLCSDQQKCCLISLDKKFCIGAPDQVILDCRGGYNAECNTNDDCELVVNLECLPVIDGIGEPKTCQCKSGEHFDSTKFKCAKESPNSYDSKTAMQIYKITMIFASCCLALILIIFLVCILRKSYCPPRRQIVPLDNSTIPDIFTLFPHVGNYDGGPLGDGTQPPFEKPPTYDETLTLIRNEIGIPPPAYRGYSPNSTNPSTPEMSARVMITRPALLTVSGETNSSSSTSSSTDSSSETSIAGPSGHQGIDNPGFINV